MKRYIKQTLDDLRAEHARLAELIAILDRYGVATSNDYPPVPIGTKPITIAQMREAVDRVETPELPRTVGNRPRKVRSGKSPVVQYVARQRSGSIREAMVRAMEALPEPFTGPDIRAWIEANGPEVLRGAGKSTISSTLSRLRGLDWIRELGDKKNGCVSYKRGKAFVGSLPAKEAAYREFRSTVPTPQPVE